MSFDLDAYLARIALGTRPSPDAAGLERIQRAHRLAIPFENLDIRLGRGIRIDGGSVFAKLVTAKRGGYCFEQNRLFGDALAALGFDSRPLLARVLLGTDPGTISPKTHTLRLVTIDGQEWIADAGFGGSYSPPMPLADAAEVTAPDGARFRLREEPGGSWLLGRDGHPAATDGRGTGEGFQPQFCFTLDAVADADLEMANHWTSTRPATRFLDLVVVSIALPTGFASLTDRAYRRHSASDGETAATIDDPRAYRLRLSMLFGIDLSAEEVAGLGLF